MSNEVFSKFQCLLLEHHGFLHGFLGKDERNKMLKAAFSHEL